MLSDRSAAYAVRIVINQRSFSLGGRILRYRRPDLETSNDAVCPWEHFQSLLREHKIEERDGQKARRIR